MKILFAGQVAKDPSFPDANEDAMAFAKKANRVAISDGASESFDSKTWACLLTARYVDLPELSLQWLSDGINEYLAKFDVAQMSWSKQASFERGSFASLLGIEQQSEDNTVEVLAVGDSLAVFLDRNKQVDSFPYKHSEDFQKRPELFCTELALNPFMSSSSFFQKHSKYWSLKDKQVPVVLCMTDALGEWALRKEEEGDPVWQLLTGIREVSELEELVLRERKAKAMRIDDITLMSISFRAEGRDELSDS